MQVVHTGLGMHSGSNCRASITAGAPGSGWTVNGARLGPGLVASCDRCTTLRLPDGARIATVEHLLAALLLARCHDALIEVEGGEVPILDGSALPWLEAIAEWPRSEAAGWSPARAIEIRDGAARVRIEPGRVLSLDVTIDFPGLGRQRYVGAEEALAGDLAAARTFGFADEVEELRARGLIAGGDLHNALVFDAGGRLVNRARLRFPDEPVRHKALDLLGDLTLLGRAIAGHVVAHCAGHRLHHRLVRALTPGPMPVT